MEKIMEIKKVQIIPDDHTIFCQNVLGMCLNSNIKKFLIQSVSLRLENVDPIDDFYLDSYKDGFNFYNYSQKQTALDKIHFFKNGYKTKELNYFNYEYNYFNNDGEYVKVKNKRGYDNYYNYICMKFGTYRQDDKYIYVKPYTISKLNNLVFDDFIIQSFIKFLIECYNKGLWLNNFNNYSIRYDKTLEQFYAYDVDMFYILADNEDLVHIQSEEDFIKMYMKVKTRPKEIIYRLKDNDISNEAAEYLYYSYWFFENVSKYMRENYKDLI